MPALSIPRAPLPVALAAGLGLLLAGCGGGSSPAAGPSAASPAATAAGSPSPSASGIQAGLLTGHFCTDLNHLGESTALNAKVARKIAHSRQAAVSYLKETAADFTALGKEGGPKVARFMVVLAGEYQALAVATQKGSSLADLQRKAPSVIKPGPSGAAFRGLATYMQKHCL
jgi:hypothetical protein